MMVRAEQECCAVLTFGLQEYPEKSPMAKSPILSELGVGKLYLQSMRLLRGVASACGAESADRRLRSPITRSALPDG
jgi:hypothetical protein